MKNYGRTSVYEFLGDFVVYRNLVPLEPQLPPLAEVRGKVGLPGHPPGEDPHRWRLSNALQLLV
jgi:hypothetical protein